MKPVATVAKNDWNAGIARCIQLADIFPATRDLLTFYARLLETQKQIYSSLSEISGSLAGDLPQLRKHLPSLLQFAKSDGPAQLREQANDLISASPEFLDSFLLDYWHNRSDEQFFAKALVQPYARRIAESGSTALLARGDNQCPFCLGKPQVSFLKVTDTTSETGNRHLLCATCLSSWEFRRVICVSCGEERPTQLGYFQTSEYEHMRIEACDTCKRYIKGVDLTILGLAVPLVDDVATAALDVWATEKGYTKIELNLIGL